MSLARTYRRHVLRRRRSESAALMFELSAQWQDMQEAIGAAMEGPQRRLVAYVESPEFKARMARLLAHMEARP